MDMAYIYMPYIRHPGWGYGYGCTISIYMAYLYGYMEMTGLTEMLSKDWRRWEHSEGAFGKKMSQRLTVFYQKGRGGRGCSGHCVCCDKRAVLVFFFQRGCVHGRALQLLLPVMQDLTRELLEAGA